MRLLFTILGYLFFLLFALGAVAQYNDPDSFLWIAIYALAALLSLGFALDRLSYGLLLVAGVICFMGFIYLYPLDFQGFDLDDGDITTVELGREAFGLLIISVVMLVFGFRLRRTL